MALSRLSNFLKSSRGKILHVNPENLDATDSITNQGSTPFTPFKTLNRALLECARYSYQIGNQNDIFNFCTILLYSGTHYVDNRPGLVIEDDGTKYSRNGTTGVLNQFDLNTVFDITDPTNQLYLLNSVHGGVIVPRGTSILAQDLRKTEIIPLYVPDPRDQNIERSSIFKITGASFFFSFSITDADPTGFCYKNYSTQKFTPNFSHHKLTAFEFIDGVKPVSISDQFLNVNTSRTDLEQYYEKISIIYGESSGRKIDTVTYSDGVSVDIQPVIDEFRIVGPRGDAIGISSIFSGDGVTASELITVTLDNPVEGISVDTSVQISGVNVRGYDGQFVVSAVPSENQIQYITPTIPTVVNPAIFGATVNIISDTIASSSPYVFNVSLKSVYGMCGLHADGSKVEGFKSVVVAQFTAISLQKDDDAFVIYDEESGTYVDSTVVSDLYKNTRSRYKPEFENFHIKVSNDAFAQLVSVFSIGYATQIVAESGGDYSVTNSNSNFGAKTFVSSGFKNNAFNQDDYGFIIGVVPPQEIDEESINISFSSFDNELSIVNADEDGKTDRLYFYNETDIDSPPTFAVSGFKIGAKKDDLIFIEYPFPASSKVVIPNTTNSFENSFTVQRQNNDFENTIINGVITLTEPHNFSAGEKVRVISQNGHLPDGIDPKEIYYVINSSIDNTLTTSQIKLAVTFNNSINNVAIIPNKKGGKLSIVSRVSDKIPNEPGHPIQWDETNENWYLNVDRDTNGIFDALAFGPTSTSKSFVTRKYDNRVEENKIYKLLYCIPKNTGTSARPPVNGFILQESNKTNLSGPEFQRYFNLDISTETQLRNPKFISNAVWSFDTKVVVTTELPHKFVVGDTVEIVNVVPSGFNGTYDVIEIPNDRQFVYELIPNPGVFSNATTNRNSSLPYVKRKNTKNIFQIYRSEEVQKYIQNKQDGLYELTVIHNSVSPTIAPFENLSFSQPIKNLYPQLDRDNPDADPKPTQCFADTNVIGNVLVNDPRNSVTKETFNKFNSNFSVGLAVTAIISNQAGTSHTIFTSNDHGLSGITSFSIVSAGASYVPGTYYGVDVNNLAWFNTPSGGRAASLKVVVGNDQSISSIDIMHEGSNYSVNDTVNILTGIGTTAGFVPAVLEISGVRDNVEDHSITLNGFNGDYSDYNNTYIITARNDVRQLTIESSGPISGASTIRVNTDAVATFNGKVIDISNIFYDQANNISLITTEEPHGLTKNSSIRIVGFTSEFSVDLLVSNVYGVNDIGVKFGPFPSTGSGKIISKGLSPTAGSNRLSYYYTDNKTKLDSTLTEDGTIANIVNPQQAGLSVGDYIECNGEILRIRSNIVANFDFVTVYRAQFGTVRKTHNPNSIIRKIQVVPVELRRNSIIRASGHTFEYVGYGAGNYSTSLPENQDREIEKEEKLLSISTKTSGGVVYYTGMDENGDFYSANRKLSSATGEEEVYDLPAPTVVGESSTQDPFNLIDSQKIIASESLRVEGGENNDILSTFNGPVVINNKLTSYSKDGIETSSIFIRGSENIARQYTISNTTPTNPGNFGDIVFRSNPQDGNNLGWVYTTNNDWRTWGFVGESGTQLFIFSGDEFGPNIQEGVVNKIKFVGDPSGFGVDVDIDVDPLTEFATIVLRNPVDVINFGTDLSRANSPTFGLRTPGTRVVYYDSLNNNNVDYSVGVGDFSLWWSIPQRNDNFSYQWYAGQTAVMSLSGTGKLFVANGIDGTLFGDVEGNATTATSANNLRRRVNAGIGLTGGGLLDRDVTLSVNVQPDGGISVVNNSLRVDSSVIRTTGDQSISGTKSFTNTILGSINGTANNANRIFRVGISTSDSGDYRLLLGPTNSTVGFTSTFVVSNETRLTYNPLNNILNTNISGDAAASNTVRTRTRNRADGRVEYLTFVEQDNRPTASDPIPRAETVRTSAGLFYDSSEFNLSCRGDIIAFANATSDDRLKENKKIIENPLEKINSISGFTYNWNKKANDLGLISNETQVGVSAQEVQKVLPEAVKLSELDNEDILTVKYEKLIPLLIEAIKEQNKEIENLKHQIKSLEAQK